MTPLLREKIVDYLSYYGLSLAQENLDAKTIEDIKFMKGAFTTLFKLKGVFEGLKLSQPKQEEK